MIDKSSLTPGIISSIIASIILSVIGKTILKLGTGTSIALFIFFAIAIAVIFSILRQKSEARKAAKKHRQEKAELEAKQAKYQKQKTEIHDFLNKIEEDFNKLILFHLPEPISLKDQYIPIQVTLERKFRHEVEIFTGYPESDDMVKQAYAYRWIDCEEKQSQVSWEEAKKNNKRIMVLADPGMGKSTLLKMEALSIAHAEKEKLKNGNIDDIILPIFIRLDYLSKSEKEVVEDVVDYVQKEYKSSKDIIDLLRKKMDDGKCLLLLDALDEVPGDRRNDLSEKLNRFTRNSPCPIICTSRIVGYGAPLLADAKEVEIVPFSQKQIGEYIRTWFKIAVGHIGDETVTDEKLIKELKDKPQVQGLAQNPLLLSLICSLYQEKEITLPARRCEIYEKALDYMLDEWRQEKKYQPEGMADAKKELLGYLAYHFSCRGTEIFSRNDIRKQIEEHLSSDEALLDLKGLSPSKLIDELSNDDGIIPKAEREGDRYMFLHRTFQEYLTALYMKRTDGIKLAEEHFWNYDWHETLSLLVGLMDDPIPMLQTIMDEKDDIFYSMLILACRCLTECKENPHELVKGIVEKVYNFWKGYPWLNFIESVIISVSKTNQLMLKNLINALNDKDKYIRWHAADKLGKIGLESLFDILMTVFREDNCYVKESAAFALGLIGSDKAVNRLMLALGDEDKDVRTSAAFALGLIGSDKAVNRLMLALGDEDKDVGTSAAEAIAEIGSDKVLSALTKALDDERYDIKWCAVHILGKIGSEKAITVLLDALRYNDIVVRWKATCELGKIGFEMAINILLDAFKHKNSAIRQDAAYILGKINSKKIIDALLESHNDKDRYVRRKIIHALGDIGSIKAIPILIDSLIDKDDGVKWESAYALSKMGLDNGLDILTQSINISDKFIKSIWGLGNIGSEKAVDALIKALDHQNSDVRSRAAYALGKIGSEKAVDALIKALDDEDSSVRWSAADALGKIGVPDVLERIISEPAIDIYNDHIFNLARKLAIKFSTSKAKREEKLDFIPVYPELLAHKKKKS